MVFDLVQNLVVVYKTLRLDRVSKLFAEFLQWRLIDIIAMLTIKVYYTTF